MSSENNWKLTTHPDEANDSATLFGVAELSDTITEFLTSSSTKTPLVMAIRGEWGSGKTTLVKTTKKKLEKVAKDKNSDVKVVYYNAWAFESGNPASALIYKMLEPFERKGNPIAHQIAKLALDVVTRKGLNMTFDEVKKHFTTNISATDNLRLHIETALKQSLPSGILITIIDELDRCNLENTLVILNSVNLFMTLPRCVFLVAVDISKVEAAWLSRYGNDPKLEAEGTSYLDKIFQYTVNMPPKTNDQIISYVKQLVPNIPEELSEIIAIAGPKNPRKMKKLLNQSAFRSMVGSNKTRKKELAVLWTVLEHLIGDKKSMDLYNSIAKHTNKGFINFVKTTGDQREEEYLRIIHNEEVFTTIHGLPSGKDKITYNYFKMTAALLTEFKENDEILNASLDEIVKSALES